MQVELLTNGGYSGTGMCVGKVFDVTPHLEGYKISLPQLEAAGYENDGTIKYSLYFLPHEVRVINES